MKTTPALFCLFLSLASFAGQAEVIPADESSPTAKKWTVTHRTAYENVWESTTLRTNPITLHVHETKHSYVQLGAGLNLPQPDGSFRPADASFTLTANGAEARNTLHKVVLAPDINVEGAVAITMADGAVLRSNPIGFGYYDPVDGRQVILGALTNAVGWLVASNEVVYSNCFNGVRASVHYRNLPSGLSQNLILHEQPMPPEVFGLSSKSWLQLFTQFTSDTPTPAQTTRTLSREKDPAVRQSMVSPDLTDTTLSFSAMRMKPGRAFGTAADTQQRPRLNAPVGKSFSVIQGQKVLVENVEYQRIKDIIAPLPLSAASGITNASIAPAPSLPTAHLTTNSTERIQRLALGGSLSRSPQYAFVLDYEILNASSLTDYTFKGDTTYDITDDVQLSGATIMEGGTVLKFEDFGLVEHLAGTLDVRSSDYQPVVLTCATDDSIGEQISSGSGPVQTSNPGLSLASSDATVSLSNMRFSYLFIGLQIWVPAGDLRHLVFVQCGEAIQTINDIDLGNGLFDHCDVVFDGSSVEIRGEHLTVDTASYLQAGSSSLMKFTNCIFAAVSADEFGTGNDFDASAHNAFYACAVSELFGDVQENGSGDHHVENGPFVTVGAGAHYLDRITGPISAGTKEGIPDALFLDIHRRTTQPPVLLEGSLQNDSTFRPQPLEDNEEMPSADLGFHYPIIHYLVSGAVAENTTVTLRDGVVVAFDFREADHGLRLRGSQFVSIGTATRLNRFIRAHAVQEQSLGNSLGGLGDFYFQAYNTTLSDARFRFSEFCSMSGDGDYFYNLLCIRA